MYELPSEEEEEDMNDVRKFVDCQGYPSFGYPRQVALPMCHEYILSQYRLSSNHRALKKKSMAHFLEKMDNRGFLKKYLDFHRGESYCSDMVYAGLKDVGNSFLEASVLYQPILLPPLSRHVESPLLDDAFFDGLPSVMSPRAFSTQMKQSVKAVKVNRTRLTSSYIGSGMVSPRL